MDPLHAMNVFVKIVETGNLSRTWRALQISLPVVSRALAALETRLGVRLFNRTTRRLALTEAGGQYYAQCKRILEELAEAELSISRQERRTDRDAPYQCAGALWEVARHAARDEISFPLPGCGGEPHA